VVGGRQVKALIVYDTKYGMTEKIAQAISSGMKGAGITDLVVRKAGDATEEDFRSSDAWIVGAPTHMTGLTKSTKKALKTATKVDASGKSGTAFDTRFRSADKGAVDRIKRTMREAGIKVIVEPEWFIVTRMKGPLADGEDVKAATFGQKIAAELSR
jgi:flavorubredoxin